MIPRRLCRTRSRTLFSTPRARSRWSRGRMRSPESDPITVATEAVRLAEGELVGVPCSAGVAELRRRLAALKSVLHGFVLAILTHEQHRRLANDAVRLAAEATSHRIRVTA